MNESRTKTRIITRAVIKSLVAGGIFSAALVAPNSMQLVDLYFKKLDKRSARKTLSYLKYRKLIEVKEINGQEHYRLTSKGKVKYKKIQLEELKIKTPRKWDGKWRLVMFDIPVYRRNEREDLLQKLKELNFYMLQHSAWIHPFDGEKQIGILIDTLQLNTHVTYLVVEEGNFTDHAEAYFKSHGLLM